MKKEICAKKSTFWISESQDKRKTKKKEIINKYQLHVNTWLEFKKRWNKMSFVKTGHAR